MLSTIQQELKNIEIRYEVKILYVCESGSRAWGFPSANSDYDVRFLYVHPRDWYLSIVKKRDVIELPMNEVLDINGWDLKKALQHVRKSNPVMFEWLSSPIVYKAHQEAVILLKELAQTAFLPIPAFYHYFSITKRSLALLNETQPIKIKTYFYALRPLLCCQWIVDCLSPPPMRFEELINTYIPQGELREAIERLLEQRQQGHETETTERVTLIDNYLMTQLPSLESQIPKNPRKVDIKIFDKCFRRILNLDLI